MARPARVLPLVERKNGYQILRVGHATIAPGATGKPAAPPSIVKPYDANPGISDALNAATDAAEASEWMSKQALPIAQKLGAVCSNQILADSTSVSEATTTASEKSHAAVTAHLNNGGKSPDTIETNAINAAITAGQMANTIAKRAYATLLDQKVCSPAPAAPKPPPFDTISANYTFTVSANIGIAPTWTLVHVTGPSGTSSAASTAAAWTNNLSIILAPTVSSSANSDVNNQRLIQSLRPPPAPGVVAPF